MTGSSGGPRRELHVLGFGRCTAYRQVDVKRSIPTCPRGFASKIGMGMLKRIARRVAGALGIAAAASLTLAPQVAEAKTAPALWSVSDADTTVYLFGTIHLLPQKTNWQTPKFEKAVDQSQQLVVETIVDEKNPAAIMSIMAKLGFSDSVPPLAQRVKPEQRAALADAIKKSGLPPTAFDRMETWAAAFILLGNQFRALGLEGGQGVEAILRNDFSSHGKPIGELETNAEQLGFFDALPENAQVSLLEGAIEKPESMKTEFSGMIAAWTRGDVDAIAKSFNKDLAESSDLREALLKRRNANWTRWIKNRMATPGSVMIAVGAGHLAGHDSVIDMLQKGGYKVRRIQ